MNLEDFLAMAPTFGLQFLKMIRDSSSCKSSTVAFVSSRYHHLPKWNPSKITMSRKMQIDANSTSVHHYIPLPSWRFHPLTQHPTVSTSPTKSTKPMRWAWRWFKKSSNKNTQELRPECYTTRKDTKWILTAAVAYSGMLEVTQSLSKLYSSEALPGTLLPVYF